MLTTETKQKAPSFLSNDKLRLLIFGGKGGTGKTTSAAATAMYLSQLAPWKRILIVSTDPAHSLADSFDQPIGAKKTAITPNLAALELDPQTLLSEFKERHSKVMGKFLHRASILDQANIRDFLSFSLPGMEEIMLIMQIALSLKSTWDKPNEYDLVILDTAPTGHTLRLLALPDKMSSWFKTMDVSLDRYRKGTFRAVPFNFPWIEEYHRGDSVDQFVATLTKDLEMVRSLLTNPEETEFVPVTIPESLGILETEDLLSTLEEMDMPVRNIVVNRVQARRQCPFCSSRRREQGKYMAQIKEEFASYNLVKMPLFPHEVRGKKGLLKFAQHLEGKPFRIRVSPRAKPLPQGPPRAKAKVAALLKSNLQFILFGGKGGVGKTSIAAATALYLARRNPSKKILVYSTDPAHSLADSFDYPIGDQITLIEGVPNLYALEVDAGKMHRDFMEEYKVTIEEAFDTWQKRAHTWGLQQELKYDSKVMSTFVETSPPGLSEVFTLERVLDSVEREEFDLYILDTAPTGHLLYLLEFPDLVREWMRITFRALLKHQREKQVPQLQTIADRIVRSTNSAKKIREIITDPQRSELVTITIPEAMGVLEMEDLLSAVVRLGISCQHIIINMISPPTECGFCTAKRREQLKYVRQVKKKAKPRGYLVTELELFPREIKGLDALTNLGQRLGGNGRRL